MLKPHDRCMYCQKGWVRFLPEYLADKEPHVKCGDGVMVHGYPRPGDEFIRELRKNNFQGPIQI